MDIAVNTLPFWARFTLGFDLRWDGVNPTNQVIQAGQKIELLSYKQGDGNVPALGGDAATQRDTILINASQTRGGALYDIRGMSFTKDGMIFERVTTDQAPHGKNYWPGMSVQAANGVLPYVPSVEDMRALEDMFLQIFLGTFRIEIKIDGTKRTLEMGPNPFYPGIGGAKDSIASSNGDVFNSNFMPITEGITWNPAGAVDSNMRVVLEADRNVNMPAWVTPDDANLAHNRTAIGRNWQLPILMNFHGREESPTSQVS